MLRGVWQALNCLSIHATYCVIIAGASPGETKMWAAVRKNGRFFALAVRITGKLLKIDGYMLRGVWQALNIVFSFMQRFAWLPQGRPQGKQKCGKNRDFWTYALISASYNSETIKEDRNRITLWSLVNFLSTYSDKKSCNTSTTSQIGITRFVSDSWASCLFRNSGQAELAIRQLLILHVMPNTCSMAS